MVHEVEQFMVLWTTAPNMVILVTFDSQIMASEVTNWLHL